MSPAAVTPSTEPVSTASAPAAPQTNGIAHPPAAAIKAAAAAAASASSSATPATNGDHSLKENGAPGSPASSSEPSTAIATPSEPAESAAAAAAPPKQLEGDELKAALLKQLEFYFSKENLSSDTYLVSNMSQDLFVPVDIVANFKMVKALTSDINLIVEVLRTSSQVTVDGTGKLVKPNITMQRSTIILRDIPSDVPEEEIRSIFSEGCAAIKSARPDIGDTWFITFETEDDAINTLFVIRERKFRGRPVQGRIKSENLLKSVYVPRESRQYNPYGQNLDGMMEMGPDGNVMQPDYGYYVGPGTVPYSSGRSGWGYNMNGAPYYVDQEYMVNSNSNTNTPAAAAAAAPRANTAGNTNDRRTRQPGQPRSANPSSGPRSNGGRRPEDAAAGASEQAATTAGGHHAAGTATSAPGANASSGHAHHSSDKGGAHADKKGAHPSQPVILPVPHGHGQANSSGSRRQGGNHAGGAHHAASSQPAHGSAAPSTQQHNSKDGGSTAAAPGSSKYSQPRRKAGNANEHRAPASAARPSPAPLGLDAFPPLPPGPGGVATPASGSTHPAQQAAAAPVPGKSYSTVATTEPKPVEPARTEPKKELKESTPSGSSAAAATSEPGKDAKDNGNHAAASGHASRASHSQQSPHAPHSSRDSDQRRTGTGPRGNNSPRNSPPKDRRDAAPRHERSDHGRHHHGEANAHSGAAATSAQAAAPVAPKEPAAPSPMSYAQILKTKAKPVEKPVPAASAASTGDKPEGKTSAPDPAAAESKADSAFDAPDVVKTPQDESVTEKESVSVAAPATPATPATPEVASTGKDELIVAAAAVVDAPAEPVAAAAAAAAVTATATSAAEATPA